MSQTKPQPKKSFEKDTTAHAIVELMADDSFTDMPDSYKAQEVGISLSNYQSYMNDPLFLRWTVSKLQDLYVKNLPALLHTMFEQATQGAGRQQKMLLDFMKVTAEDKETKSPNIVIVNNIPNPDNLKDVKDETIIEITEDRDVGTS